MWNFGDGFDFWKDVPDGSLGTGAAVWDTYTSGQGAYGTGTNTRFSAGQSMIQHYSGGATKAVANNDQTHHIVFAYKRQASNAVCYTSFTLYDGTAAQCTVSIHGDGSVRLYSGAGASGAGNGTNPAGTLLATAASVWPLASIWYQFEIEVKISSTAGQMKVRINGNNVDDYASAATLNTRNGGTGNDYANKITIWDQGGAYNGGQQAFLDDFLWFTTAGAAPNTWVGDIRAVQQMPASDATVQMTPNSGTNNYSRVNQAVEDGDTSYVSSSTVGQIDYYNAAALATTPASIIGVQTKMMSRKTDAGTRQARITTKSGSTVTTGSTVTLSTSYLYTSKLDTVDPATSAAWTGSGVNAYQVGVELVA